MILRNAAKELQRLTDTGRTAAYDALKANGRFAGMIQEDLIEGVLRLSADAIRKHEDSDE